MDFTNAEGVVRYILNLGVGLAAHSYPAFSGRDVRYGPEIRVGLKVACDLCPALAIVRAVIQGYGAHVLTGPGKVYRIPNFYMYVCSAGVAEQHLGLGAAAGDAETGVTGVKLAAIQGIYYLDPAVGGVNCRHLIVIIALGAFYFGYRYPLRSVVERDA